MHNFMTIKENSRITDKIVGPSFDFSCLEGRQQVLLNRKLVEMAFSQYDKEFRRRYRFMWHMKFDEKEVYSKDVDLSKSLERMRGVRLRKGMFLSHIRGGSFGGSCDTSSSIKNISFYLTFDGIVSASYLSMRLPYIGLWWHGIYEPYYNTILNDGQMIETPVSFGDMHEAEIDYLRCVTTGIRVSKAEGGFECSSLGYCSTKGLADVSIKLNCNGSVSSYSVLNLECYRPICTP